MRLYWLVIFVYCLSATLLIYPQANENTGDTAKEVMLSVESPLTVFIGPEDMHKPLIINGKSNLPGGTIIKLNVWGKITSLTHGRIELLNTYRTIIDRDGAWRQTFQSLPAMSSWAETYKIGISIDEDSFGALNNCLPADLQKIYC